MTDDSQRSSHPDVHAVGRARTVSHCDIAPDCRHYLGDRPCKANRLCRGCDEYDPFDGRICVIKLGALGDVIRTLCILPEIRRRFPRGQITWVTKPNAARMLAGHPQIDRLLTFDGLTSMRLIQERFDLAICLDKEPEPTALLTALSAETRLGVSMSVCGTPVPANDEAVPYFALGLSDQIKFVENTKSYPALVYSALGWPYHGQRYRLPLNEQAHAAARAALESAGWVGGRPTIGINVGAGKVFANKMWPAETTAQIANALLRSRPDYQIVWLGGPEEEPIIEQLQQATASMPGSDRIISPGCRFDEATFVGLVDHLDVLLTGDTMAMHVGVALDKPCIVWFGPTCEQEIDVFGRGEKLVTNVNCAPCYCRRCPEQDACVQSVDVDHVVQAVLRWADDAAAGKTDRAPARTIRLAG